jgi:translation initiation factor 1 (eIF-1/SUI1)
MKSGSSRSSVRPKMPLCGFQIPLRESDKSLPVKIRKTAKGKKVTVLGEIRGSREKALITLKQLLGVGGEVSPDQHDAIELQGDQTKRIEQTLRTLGALAGDEPKETKIVTVERRNYGYDKFAKNDDDKKKAVVMPSPPEKMSPSCILVHGNYWPYCTGFCEYCPPLTDVFEGLDMYCSWFEPAVVVQKSPADAPILPMTKTELDSALSELGLKAETGSALKNFHQERVKRVEDFVKKVRPVISHPPSHPPPRVVRPRAPADRPVRVILNAPVSSPYWWCFLLRVQLVDRSLWMSEYEEFLVSLMNEADLGVVSHEMEDSRTIELRFEEKKMRDMAKAVLETAVPNFFIIESIDPEAEEDEVVEEVIVPVTEESVEDRDFQDVLEEESPESAIGPVYTMATELGLENNEQFWEVFCEVMDAHPDWEVEEMFGEAVLRVVPAEDEEGFFP